MARKLHSRYHFTGNLITKSPLHVGGLGGDVDSDLALAVNGNGDYYIPGTSLAGALRNWMAIIDESTTNFLWGDQNPSSNQGHASFIIVEDAKIELGSQITEVRDNVAIDRNLGTAVDKMKFDRMILPRGVTIPFDLILERPVYKNPKPQQQLSDKDKLTDPEWKKYKTCFIQLLKALQEEQISLGAAKTRGLGRVKLDNLKVTEQVLNTSEGILTILQQGGKSPSIGWNNLLQDTHLEQLSNFGKIEIEIQWKPTSPVMVKTEGEGIAVDILPLISGFHGGTTFVLPGSSIKGALRTQAERIIRTVCQKDIPRIDDDSHKTFNDQIDLELVKTLFGLYAKLDKNNQQLGYLGALSVDDCFAKVSLKHWDQVETATNEKQLKEALNNNSLNQTQQAFHVAIDRWTGGAAEGYLYSVLEPIGVNWNPINLSLNLHRLNRKDHEDEKLPCLALLLLTLRDLMNEKIPLGFGTNRGMGSIEVTQIKLTGVGDLNELDKLNDVTLTSFDLSKIDSKLLDNLQTQWNEWIPKVET